MWITSLKYMYVLVWVLTIVYMDYEGFMRISVEAVRDLLIVRGSERICEFIKRKPGRER